jgi:hypothetical protein
MANGQVIMIRTDAYRELGGHESVKSVLIEDIAMARLAKRRGYRLRVGYGFDMAGTRMYASFGQIWSGWSRIFYGGGEGALAHLLLSIALLLLFTLTPYALLIGSAAALVTVGGAQTAGLLAISAALVTTMVWLLVRVSVMSRCRAGYMAFHLPAALIALGILLDAVSRRLLARDIVWHGTAYDSDPDSQSAPLN